MPPPVGHTGSRTDGGTGDHVRHVMAVGIRVARHASNDHAARATHQTDDDRTGPRTLLGRALHADVEINAADGVERDGPAQTGAHVLVLDQQSVLVDADNLSVDAGGGIVLERDADALADEIVVRCALGGNLRGREDECRDQE